MFRQFHPNPLKQATQSLLQLARSGASYERLEQVVNSTAQAYQCVPSLVWRELNRAAGDLP